ncbi:MAG: PorT family protein [Cytophagales bacterium]|nr:PorT family protein [Cytophagales bacterium]
MGMKRYISSIAFVFALSSLLAQQGEVTFGIKAGMNWAQLNGSDVNYLSNAGDPKSGIGISAGIELNSKVGKFFWLKHYLGYSQNNTILQLKDAKNPTYEAPLRRHYIDIFPISPTFHFKGLQVYAGPFVSVLAGATLEKKDSTGAFFVDKSFYGNASNLSKYAQKFDAGLVVGLEYEFTFGLNLAARYMIGFVPIYEDASQQAVINIYNQNLVFMIGYSFLPKE